MITSAKRFASWLGVCGLLASAAPVGHAHAFCGFYVTGADTSLYANATMVVLMRDGMRTVLSMQNNYQGPPEDFALVIPVPMVLQEAQVKTLPKEVFQHVDTLAAPRLVEYWESDPCQQWGVLDDSPQSATNKGADAGASVTVEAQFKVGEYDIVILSANDSSSLENWLTANEYNIPSGAADVLQPYVAAGTKFFVAKVDPAKVGFEDGQAVLSPLRFYYDTPEFSLPIRLGLLNSQGTQDLIISILAPSRYEVANHPNVIIPTNIRVQNEVRDSFPAFYEALFAKTVEKAPAQAVVTEYAWSASSCDPCPTPPLTASDLATLGADITLGLGPDQPFRGTDYVLTRLHYRYTQATLGEDLVFEEAPGLVGGRGVPDTDGNLQDTTMSSGQGDFNAFQGRYVILHPWEESLTCQDPQRGYWGGPSGAQAPSMTQGLSNTALTGAPASAGDLPKLIAESIDSLGVEATRPLDPLAAPAGGAGGQSGSASGAGGSGGNAAVDGGAVDASAVEPSAEDSGCSCSAPGATERSVPAGLWGLGLALAIGIERRARRRRGRAVQA